MLPAVSKEQLKLVCEILMTRWIRFNIIGCFFTHWMKSHYSEYESLASAVTSRLLHQLTRVSSTHH